MLKNGTVRLICATRHQVTRNSPLRMFSAQNTTDLSSAGEDDVILENIGDCGLIVLNRPKALNALNLSMVNKIYPALKEWESSKKLVLIKGTGDKAFCAGGDVKSLVLALHQPGGDQVGKDFFRAEYTMNHLIGTYKKPYVALINGITMGGGAGLSVHGKYRIATEKTVFAMPETGIGLFPDVGGSHFLPKLKSKLGLYLGLTGHVLRGVDVLQAGIATHYISSDKLESVTKNLLSEPLNVDKILNQHCSTQNTINQDFSLAPHLKLINQCFSEPTVEHIIGRLERNNSEWALKTVEILNQRSPTALKVTKRAFDEGSTKNLAECLTMEFRLSCASLNKDSDFAEGVRAQLIDKDKKPVWNPKSLKDVSDLYIHEKFTPLNSQHELKLAKL